MVVSGLLALARRVVHGGHGAGRRSAGRTPTRGWTWPPGSAFSACSTRWASSAAGSAHVYLTKDLFFSGHTATTFLLLLYAWPDRRLRWPMLLGHAVVVATVFFSHLHYTIDVLGAYAMAFTAYALAEWRPRQAPSAPPAASSPS
jgi:hypothetical protein